MLIIDVYGVRVANWSSWAEAALRPCRRRRNGVGEGRCLMIRCVINQECKSGVFDFYVRKLIDITSVYIAPWIFISKISQCLLKCFFGIIDSLPCILRTHGFDASFSEQRLAPGRGTCLGTVSRRHRTRARNYFVSLLCLPEEDSARTAGHPDSWQSA